MGNSDQYAKEVPAVKKDDKNTGTEFSTITRFGTEIVFRYWQKENKLQFGYEDPENKKFTSFLDTKPEELKNAITNGKTLTGKNGFKVRKSKEKGGNYFELKNTTENRIELTLDYVSLFYQLSIPRE